MKPWLTKAILKSIKTKNKLYTKCYKQNKPELIAYYKKYLNKLTFIKRLAKEQYYTSQLLKHKQDISKQWSIINELLDQNKRCSNTNIQKLTTKNDENIESKSEISNTLNDYFANVGANLSAQAGTGIDGQVNMGRRLSKIFVSFYKDKFCYDLTYLLQYDILQHSVTYLLQYDIL